MADFVLSKRATEFFDSVKKRLGLTSKLQTAPASRFKHLVRSGESVANVAKSCLGDERFASLIITINRSSIVFDRDGVALLTPGTLIEMPATDELRIHRSHYPAVVTKPSIPPRIPLNSKRLSTIAMDVVEKFTVEVEEDNQVTQLSEGCRILIGSQGPIGTQFSVKLQALFHGGYMTIAAYESILGRTRRAKFKPDGSCNQLDIDLPADVAKEMARRDFQRNWRIYWDGYFLSPTPARANRSQWMPLQTTDTVACE